MMARSPGYWRTLIGALAVPFKWLVKVPRYVPPLSQIVSPGPIDGSESAVARSHGRARLPSPSGLPTGAAKYADGPGEAWLTQARRTQRPRQPSWTSRAADRKAKRYLIEHSAAKSINWRAAAAE